MGESTCQLLKELPYFNLRGDLKAIHGQFNNSLANVCKTRKSLDKLTSLYELDLFTLNTRPDLDLSSGDQFLNPPIHSRYFSPPNFMQMKNKSSGEEMETAFSVFHNNVVSLNLNLENLQTRVLCELEFHFNIIAVTETKITNSSLHTCAAQIPGYVFECVPTPLVSGGVGMFINESLNYRILEKTTNEAFQAL